MVPSGDALPHRADEENRPLPARAPRTDPQLLPGSKAAFQRRRRGSEQQSQSHHEKILRFRAFRCLELALYHSLGKLPEPESTHDFFLRTLFHKPVSFCTSTSASVG